jgi:hypothetical protein
MGQLIQISPTLFVKRDDAAENPSIGKKLLSDSRTENCAIGMETLLPLKKGGIEGGFGTEIRRYILG